MNKPPKKVKHLLRRYENQAYEHELRMALTRLDRHFAAWREGEISSVELDQHIHAYKKGPARELYGRYQSGLTEMNVAYAIVTGMLDRETIPAQVLQALEQQIGFYESLKQKNELRMPGEP